MKKLLMLAVLALGVVVLRGGGGGLIYIKYQPDKCDVRWAADLGGRTGALTANEVHCLVAMSGVLWTYIDHIKYELNLSQYTECNEQSPCIFAPNPENKYVLCHPTNFVLKKADGTILKKVEQVQPSQQQQRPK